MQKKITIINTGSGNILSIKRAFERWEAIVDITNEKEKILSASKLVLPGVGAFKNVIDSLNAINFFDIMSDKRFKEIPLLGICVGMQLFFEQSEEFGRFKGLGLIKGIVQKLPNISLDKKKLKIPSIGWHNLILAKNTSALKNENFFDNFKKEDSFYFVHSYYANPSEKNCILASYKFGEHLIPSIVAKDNIHNN